MAGSIIKLTDRGSGTFRQGGLKTLPLKRIFCPTDFSEPARLALQTAVELAQHFSAMLLLAHVVPPYPVPYQPLVSPAPAFDVSAYLKELVNAAHHTLQNHAAEQVPEGVPKTLSVSAGDPAYEILRMAEELEADLIVIATHGRGGWRRYLFGSVADKVVRQAKSPVLVVHQESGAA
jgi:nucleotide-binding universal stress UspA family protein